MPVLACLLLAVFFLSAAAHTAPANEKHRLIGARGTVDRALSSFFFGGTFATSR